MTGRFAGLAAVAWRESRTARRRLLLYMSSITLGVAALVAIDSFAENATRTVHEQARALLGGDLALNTRDSFATPVMQLLDSLKRTGYGVARQTTFTSMAVAPDTTAMRLVQVRAVTPDYPFFDQIETNPATGWATVQQGTNAIVDAALLVALNLHVGDSIAIGAQKFAIQGTIISVPGEVAVTALVGPRVYIADRFVPQTGLLVFGSRAQYAAVIKLPATVSADQFEARFGRALGRNGVRMRTVADNEANLTFAIDQLRNFLGVVGLIALLLGGIGVASGVNAFVLRKIDTVAVLRCLGATSGQVVLIYVLQAGAMGLVGAAVGTALGVAAQFALPHLLQDYLPRGIVVAFAPRAVAMGLAIGVWVALVFSLRPLLALRRVSPLQALRRDADAVVLRRMRRDSSAAVVSFAIVASIFALTIGRSDLPLEGIGFGIAIFAAVGVLWAAAVLLIGLSRRVVRPGWPFALRQAVASLHRPGNQTRAVILSLGFGVFLMSTLYQVQTNLLQQMNVRVAQLRANLVFFDVQRDQAAGVDSIIRTGHNQLLQEIPLLTVQLTAINGRPIDSLIAAQRQARRGARGGRGAPGLGGIGRGGGRMFFQRDWRVTYSDSLDAGETITAGRWFGAVHDSLAEVSFDSAYTGWMGLSLGDVVTWNVQGVPLRARVTSFRAVDRSRLQPSFPVVFSPHSLDGAPAQFVFLVNARDPQSVAVLQRDVARRFANIASLDLSVVEQTISNVLSKITAAIRFMAGISLVLAIPVLFSAVAATRRERLREGVLYKTLGASRRQVGRMMLAEYCMLGTLGSVAGVVLSVGSTWTLMHFLFKVTFTPAVLPAVAVSVGMTLLAVAIGMLTSREVFATTPMAALREG